MAACRPPRRRPTDDLLGSTCWAVGASLVTVSLQEQKGRAKRAECLCRVTGPEYHQTRFNRACPYHGDNGSMVARVRVKVKARP
jgi:hypothetical protein